MSKLYNDVIDAVRVTPGKKIRLKDFDPGWMDAEELRDLDKNELKKQSEAFLKTNVRRLAVAQELLYQNDSHAVLVVFQGMDTSGKDGTIKHVMSGVNPQGCQVTSFKRPSEEDLGHDFLWRHVKALPERGRIGIFNRSYYEEVVVVRVHPELLERQKLPSSKHGEPFWEDRFDDINNLERHLERNGTRVIKFFLNISKKEQKQRLLERIDNPDKHWKFSTADVTERAYWNDYMEAYEVMLNATSTKTSPWFVIPADHKYVARALVAEILASTIDSLDLRLPSFSPEQSAAIEDARLRLLSEKS